MIKLLKVALLSFLLISFLYCTKDPNEYRLDYLGDFTFTTIRNGWVLSADPPTWCDTVIYVGKIRAFQTSDLSSDLSYGNDVQEENETQINKITIGFLPNKKITSILNEDGVLINKYASHYYHEGAFIGSDTIEFKVTGLGGNGGGVDYFVTGIRN